jgi:predicted NUDIX family NTP pyrophosphohydrolase
MHSGFDSTSRSLGRSAGADARDLDPPFRPTQDVTCSKGFPTLARKSAGILAFRTRDGAIEVLLVHPGGPFWRNKDRGAWSIPKGEYDGDDDPERLARREFREELGIELVEGLIALGDIRQRGGKTVTAFAAETDVDVGHIKSNTFEVEWPPRSGRRREFPEVDRAEWFDLASARSKINQAQGALLDRLESTIASRAMQNRNKAGKP